MTDMQAPTTDRQIVGDPAVDARPASVAAQFRQHVAASGAKEAFRWPEGDTWRSATWRQTGETVDELAAGLVALGVEPQQTVGIIAGTRYEWITADLAIMCAGAATTTVYPSTIAEDVKLRERRAELPAIQQVILIDGEGDGDWVLPLAEVTERGRALLADQPQVVEERSAVFVKF